MICVFVVDVDDGVLLFMHGVWFTLQLVSPLVVILLLLRDVELWLGTLLHKLKLEAEFADNNICCCCCCCCCNWRRLFAAEVILFAIICCCCCWATAAGDGVISVGLGWDAVINLCRFTPMGEVADGNSVEA